MRKLDDERETIRLFSELIIRREQEKARVVFAAVFQMLAQNHAAVFFGGSSSGDSCAGQIALSQNARHAARGVFRRDPLYLRIRRQKTPALIQRDGMRFHGGDRLEGCAGATDETVADGNDDFTNYVQLAIDELIERWMYEAGDTVLDGRQNMIRAFVFYGGKE